MAKQRRAAKPPRTPRKKKKTTSAKGVSRKSRPPAPKPRPVAARKVAPAPAPEPPPPAPAPPKKPGFYEAVAIYERGVQALQRHDFQGAAGHFRAVIDGYPEERELLERARLYLRVCERETARQVPPPQTPAERVYAATVALNSGDHSGALDQLQRALSDDPDLDHAHYTMAVALGLRGRTPEALDHLRQAIALNPDNMSLAQQDPDLESLRRDAAFSSVLNAPPSLRRRSRPRR